MVAVVRYLTRKLDHHYGLHPLASPFHHHHIEDFAFVPPAQPTHPPSINALANLNGRGSDGRGGLSVHQQRNSHLPTNRMRQPPGSSIPVLMNLSRRAFIMLGASVPICLKSQGSAARRTTADEALKDLMDGNERFL